jgi:hypothetical protein
MHADIGATWAYQYGSTHVLVIGRTRCLRKADWMECVMRAASGDPDAVPMVEEYLRVEAAAGLESGR